MLPSQFQALDEEKEEKKKKQVKNWSLDMA